ncbi:HrpD5 family protein [Paraburkholderia phenazinium]|uniref:Type III secretion protein D n=1 Tax=Paraburkholderia phenazinium TaxID=60549 RepID=A0A1G8K9A8_9BURK|nr:HrpD5 family protein [Paraburkholderia phenazinium]SDI40035.1 type III secretion protein D [Paraburkholderia phenazinium]
MTKEIRLLTGRHAGARIKLNPTQTRIGNDHEADLQISDWTLPMMELSYHDDGRISIADHAANGPAVMLDDFVPQRFDDIVLCVGDAHAAWPSDIVLLESVLAPKGSLADPTTLTEAAAVESLPQPVKLARKHRGVRNVGLAGAALLAIGCAGIALPAVLHPRVDGSMHGATPQPTVDTLMSALHRLQLDDVQVKRADGRFEIAGVVPDSASEITAHNTLEAIVPGKLVWRVGCVDQITRDLQESLHDTALQVHYLGKRTFAVVGVAKNAGAARATLEQLQGDLAPMLASIAPRFTADDRMGAPSDVESLLTVGNLQYVESSDGTKHFAATQATPEELN